MDKKYQAHYTALKILRQRCEYLQQRLDSVEEENCQLKLQKAQVQEKALNNASYNHCLEEQIILLNKQNDRMSHQIQVISTENQNLWSQLSTLLSGDETLGNFLTVSTAPGYREDLKTMEPLQNLLEDCSKESLEEISLKLINGILIGKTELENQYSQMIDLQKDSETCRNNYIFKFPIQFDCRATVGVMKGLIQKMQDFKDVLYQQKIDLNTAIKSLKSIPTNHNKNLKNDNLFTVNVRGNMGNPSNIGANAQDSRGNNVENASESDKTCPMCAMSFSGNFNSFYEHVTSHFEDGNEVFNMELFNS